jgi:hypothetical protein
MPYHWDTGILRYWWAGGSSGMSNTNEPMKLSITYEK